MMNINAVTPKKIMQHASIPNKITPREYPISHITNSHEGLNENRAIDIGRNKEHELINNNNLIENIEVVNKNSKIKEKKFREAEELICQGIPVEVVLKELGMMNKSIDDIPLMMLSDENPDKDTASLVRQGKPCNINPKIKINTNQYKKLEMIAVMGAAGERVRNGENISRVAFELVINQSSKNSPAYRLLERIAKEKSVDCYSDIASNYYSTAHNMICEKNMSCDIVAKYYKIDKNNYLYEQFEMIAAKGPAKQQVLDGFPCNIVADGYGIQKSSAAYQYLLDNSIYKEVSHDTDWQYMMEEKEREHNLNMMY